MKLLSWLEKREKYVLAGGITLYVLVFAAICLRKYALFLYNGVDLAYFNQVFWNTLNGRFFETTIQPHLSLGDHAELAIPLLVPFYAIAAGPRILLILQTLALALGAWPVWLLARRRLVAAAIPDNWKRFGPLALAAIWLLNPLVQNANLFEFHVLVFAVTPLLFALLEYDRGRKWAFLAWAGAALLCREDVALVVAAIGVLAWLEKRERFWRVVPLALGAVWFAGALFLISRFAPGGGYKFAAYYSWLGDTPLRFLAGLLRHPLKFLTHLFGIANLGMLLGLVMAFAFLPLLRPRRLLLALGPAFQLMLTAAGGALALQTHYAALFLPALVIAAIDGFAALPRLLEKIERRWHWPALSRLAAAIIALIVVYDLLTLGPLPAVGRLFDASVKERATVAREMLDQITPDANVAAGYALLPQLSSREKIYSLDYAFLGVSQFALQPYELPADTRFLAVDTADLIAYPSRFLSNRWSEPHYQGGFARLRAAAGDKVFSRGQFLLFDRVSQADFQSARLLAPVILQDFKGGLRLAGADLEINEDRELGGQRLDLFLAWAADFEQKEDLVMVVRLRRPDASIAFEGAYPFGNGLLPATELQPTAVMTDLSAPLPDLPAGAYYPEIRLEVRKGILTLDPLGTAELTGVSSRDKGWARLSAFMLEAKK